jgi:hypothetical protein
MTAMRSGKIKAVEVGCLEVQAALIDYMEGDLTQDVRASILLHLQNCSHCTAIYDGAENIVRLVREDGAIELPSGFGKRLYLRLRDSLK